MVQLNPLILEEIAAEFCREKNDKKLTYGWYEEVNNNAEHLAKFMLSGNECFRATLDYYKRSKQVKIHHHFMVVYVKPFVGKNENIHAIPYRFVFIKTLLDVIKNSIEDLIITRCPKDRRGYTVLDDLIHEGLKRVTVDDLIDVDYMTRFKDECSLEKISCVCFDVNSPNISDILAIRASCHELNTDFGDLLGHLSVSSFPGVQTLCINTHYDIKMNLLNLPPDLENLSTIITESFPILQTLNLLIINEQEIHRFAYIVILNTFRRDCFFNIHSRIKGVIHVNLKDGITPYKNAFDRLQGEPDIKFDDANQKFMREQEIHNGLTLKVEIACFGVSPSIFDFDSSEDEDVPFPHLYG